MDDARDFADKNKVVRIDGVEDSGEVKDERQRQAEKQLDRVQRGVTTVAILLGYTFIKWTLLMFEYLIHGVKAEANIYGLFLVFPFGVLIWGAGIVKLIAVCARIMRKGFPLEKLRADTKVILAANWALVLITLVELVVIVAETS